MSMYFLLRWRGIDYQPQIYRTPIYPAFLAGLGIICNWRPLHMLVLQAFFFSLGPCILLLILLRSGYPSGFAWLLVFDPITNILSITFMTEGLLILFLLTGFYFLLKADDLPQRFLALTVLTLAILVKPSVQYFFVFLCIYFLIQFRPRWKTVALIMVSILPLMGWMVRNYRIAGLNVVSTQTDVSIFIPETVKAKEEGTPDQEVLTWILKNWAQEHHGEDLFDLVMDNKLDFKGVAIQYALQHPLAFAKYHSLGSLRVLFGTARVLAMECFPACASWTQTAWRFYNLGMICYYAIIYFALLFTFRPRAFTLPPIFISWLFVFYNVLLIGILAYTTGGGLKRAPFIPFLIIALAGQYAYSCRKNALHEKEQLV